MLLLSWSTNKLIESEKHFTARMSSSKRQLTVIVESGFVEFSAVVGMVVVFHSGIGTNVSSLMIGKKIPLKNTGKLKISKAGKL